LLSFAPSHNLLATKAAIGTHNDLRFGATFTRRRNDFLERIDSTSGRGPVAGAQLGPKRDRVDKGKEWQVAVQRTPICKRVSSIASWGYTREDVLWVFKGFFMQIICS